MVCLIGLVACEVKVVPWPLFAFGLDAATMVVEQYIAGQDMDCVIRRDYRTERNKGVED